MATSTESKQMITGKSFEYALLQQFHEKLKNKTSVEIVRNSAFTIAKDCFEMVTEEERGEYVLSASFAVNFLMDLEPRLSNAVSEDDILQLEIVSDEKGKAGDVRDVLAIRSSQEWEVGVSAKNNHNAVKHSRLSDTNDFAEKWFGIQASQQYWDAVRPIFENLRAIQTESNKQSKWSDLENKQSEVYVPILNAFIKELGRLFATNRESVSANLINHLVGVKDFYKVIKYKDTVEIHAYNINGTLSLPFNDIAPKYPVSIILLPTEIVSVEMKADSDTTAIVTLDNQWVLSFRIHNASSRIEPSLKFDITLIESPRNLFKNTLNIAYDK